MALVDPTSIKLGQNIKFKVKSDHDNNLWAGTITGLYLYDSARRVDDILPYYREVAKRVEDIGPIDTLNFFSLQILENDARSVTRIFAIEYIEPSTLVLDDPHVEIPIIVYGCVDSETSSILQLLHTHGYKAYRPND